MKNGKKLLKYFFILYLLFFISITFSDFLYDLIYGIFSKPDPPKDVNRTEVAIDPMPDPPFPLPPPRKPRKK